MAPRKIAVAESPSAASAAEHAEAAGPAPPPVIEQNRKCRDILFLLVFMAFMGGMAVIAGWSIQYGHPERLVYRIDSSGYTCGYNNKYAYNANGTLSSSPGPDFTGKTKLYYVNPFDFAKGPYFQFSTPTVCVSACPGQDATYKQCVLGDLFCQSPSQYVCSYYGKSGLSLSGVTDPWATGYFGQLPLANQLLSQFSAATLGVGVSCYPIYMTTASYLNLCVPQVPISNITTAAAAAGLNVTLPGAAAIAGAFQYDRVQKYIGDLYKGYAIVLVAGMAGGIGLGFLWMIFIRLCAGIMTWLIVFSVNAVFWACTLFCFAKAGLIGSSYTVGGYAVTNTTGIDPASQDRNIFAWCGYALAALSFLLLIFTLVIIPRLRVAIATLQVAANAMRDMPTVIFFPLITFASLIAFFIYWVTVAIYLWSCGTITPVSTGGYYTSFSTNWTYVMLYHLFGLLWTTQFIAAFGVVTLAGAFAGYYWAGGRLSKSPSWPIASAFFRAWRYHLGSIALGSFLVALIQFVRIILDYIDRQTKSQQKANFLLRWLMCCAKYCVWYLEKIMKWISRNAYVMIAIKGFSFCGAAAEAIGLIVANALRLATVSVMGDFITWLGKLVVTMGCGIIAFLMSSQSQYTDPGSATQLTSPIVPIVLSIFVGYCVADVFFQVFEVAIDTMILSFCQDIKEHNGHPHFAPPLLLAAVGEPLHPEEDLPKGPDGKPIVPTKK